jgi:hypothetical protein
MTRLFPVSVMKTLPFAVKANIRVGLLLEKLDKPAEETTLRYVRLFYPTARVVTASMDNLDVLNAPDIEKEIVLRAD